MNTTETRGWICPKCGRVYAPWVDKCQYCGSSTITYTSPICPFSTTTWSCSNTADQSTANINSTVTSEVKC